MATHPGDESQISHRLYSRDSRGRFSSPRRPGGIDGGAGGGDDRGRKAPVADKESHMGYNADQLSKTRLDVLEKLLGPLRRNQSVSLLIDDSRLPKKTRRYRPVMVITPYNHSGCPKGCLLVSMPPYGAELIDPQVDLKSIAFVRLGLRHSLASALASALKQVLLGETT